jgi:DNA-binding response OmpR family regulator
VIKSNDIYSIYGMNHKIAVIEDETPIRELYRAKLDLSGFDVKTAKNGREGLQLVKEFQPDLILLDIRMPEMNGDQMLLKMREQDWGADIRVIVLTNLSKDEAPSILRFLNVDRYIVKAHYTPKQIVEIVAEILG